jgi:hypothetical protein
MSLVSGTQPSPYFKRHLSATAACLLLAGVAYAGNGNGLLKRKVDDGSTQPAPSPLPIASPSPTTTPPPSGSVELASIPSNFDVASELVPAWGNGAIPVSGAPDVVGAFRFICNPAHLAKDDPIVYPGQAGKSHLHQFFGNTAANANSTYESLRTTGQSTCNSPLNRSAYWMPAMMNGKGQVVRPDYISIYYKRRPASDPKCTASNPGRDRRLC